MNKNLDDLYDLLNEGKVEIKFKSLRSQREIVGICTLNDRMIPNNIEINQSKDSESILCFLLNELRWEDINKKTIIEYKKINEKL
jgi:hypothetical protein|tara:strand:+ start:104 stop:358 length:255 start_codon:yes stop_codon:yes gene_type:complete